MKTRLPIPLILILLLTASAFRLQGQIQQAETIILSTGMDTVSLRGLPAELIRAADTVRFSTDEAIQFLLEKYSHEYWKDENDSLRMYISQLLIHASGEPLSSVVRFMEDYDYDRIKIPAEYFYVWDSIRIRLPEDFRLDSASMRLLELALSERDSLRKTDGSSRLPIPGLQGRSMVVKNDTLLLVMVDTLSEVALASDTFPFRGYSYPSTGDSIHSAIDVLVRHLAERPDSMKIVLTGSSHAETAMWLNTTGRGLVRFWLQNEYDDSVTVWVGSEGKNTVGLYLENNIMFRRPLKSTSIVGARVDVPTFDNRTLREVQTSYVKPDYWRLSSEISLVFNQARLSNWVKGGESNISSVVDVTGNANYLNNPGKTLWYNQGRLKHGLISSPDYGIRRNVDMLELTSKLNLKAFGKFDFSGTVLFKTQLAKGYNYPKDKDPVLVSRILSPASVTVGFGLDYKPNKETSINLAPLSYKSTFVLDTLRIDQVKYGIPADRKARHEPGASVQITHNCSPFNKVKLTNKLQLFTNFIDKPQNVDIDWEMIATASINWFTDVRLNTHFIFDDDTKTVKYDKQGDPITDNEGNPKKTARIQFKEVIGFTLVFRF